MNETRKRPAAVEVMQRNRLAYEIACDLWNRVGVKHGAEDYLWGRVEQVVEERVGPLIRALEAIAEETGTPCGRIAADALERTRSST